MNEQISIDVSRGAARTMSSSRQNFLNECSDHRKSPIRNSKVILVESKASINEFGSTTAFNTSDNRGRSCELKVIQCLLSIKNLAKFPLLKNSTTLAVNLKNAKFENHI